MTEWIWDANKAKSNLQKHGVSFEAAVLVFDDPMLLCEPDPHRDGDRWRVVGRAWMTTLFVVHTVFEEGGGRIISARRATPAERKRYDNGYS
jgi:uncharacterized protein